MFTPRKELFHECEPLLDIFDLPLYGFRFFLKHIGRFRLAFWSLTAIRVLSTLGRFYSTYLISTILSSITTLTTDHLFWFYLPQFVGIVLSCELLDYFTRRYAEQFPTLYSEYASVRFLVTWLRLRSTRLLSLSKERLHQLTMKYLEGVNLFLTDWVWRIPSELTKLALVCVVLAVQSPYVLAANMVLMAGYFYLSFRNSRQFATYWEGYLKASVDSRSFSQTLFTQLVTVQRLGALPALKFFAAGHASSSAGAMNEVKRFHAYRWLVQLLIFNCMYVVTFFLGVHQVINGKLPIGFLLLITWAYESLWGVMQYLIEAYVQLIGQRENALLVREEFERLDAFFPTETAVIDPNWSRLEVIHARCEYDSEEGEHISISVPELRISAGSRVSLSGPSGAGKTTVLHMLLNLMPFQGSYKIDGKDVQGAHIPSEAISMVTAHDGFFPISLRENLTLDRKVPDEELKRVLQGLQIDFVSSLDDVFGSGVNFSAGQLQRLRLARGVLSSAPLLLLDEPFTGIDEVTKRAIAEFLRKELDGRTILIITHDPRELVPLDITNQYVLRDRTVFNDSSLSSVST